MKKVSKELKKIISNHLIYVRKLDGDNSTMYVASSLINWYRKEINSGNIHENKVQEYGFIIAGIIEMRYHYIIREWCKINDKEFDDFEKEMMVTKELGVEMSTISQKEFQNLYKDFTELEYQISSHIIQFAYSSRKMKN